MGVLRLPDRDAMQAGDARMQEIEQIPGDVFRGRVYRFEIRDRVQIGEVELFQGRVPPCRSARRACRAASHNGASMIAGCLPGNQVP